MGTPQKRQLLLASPTPSTVQALTPAGLKRGDHDPCGPPVKPKPQRLPSQGASKHEEEAGEPDDDDVEECEDPAFLAKRQWAAAEAKLRRMCEPKAVSGKVEVDKDVQDQWNDLSGGRKRLIQTMVDADRNKAIGLGFLG